MRFTMLSASCRDAAVSAARTLLAVTVSVGVLVAAARLTAQQPPEVKAGPEHARFKEWEGTWDAAVKSMGADSKGTAIYKVGLNGLWLLEHFQTDLGGQKFEGHGATSYDPTKKKYVNIWIDSMSTSPMISEGTYDQSKRTLTMAGVMPMPDGKNMKVTLTTVTKDADTKTFALKGVGADGKDVEFIQITYKRRGK